MLRILIFIFFLLISCQSGPSKVVFEKKDVTVHVEIADTPEERSLGLMYRKKMAPNEGMLFVWSEENKSPFWMKNTYLSLDMIFIDHQLEVVSIATHAIPLSEKMIPSEKPYWYVLEVPTGFVEKNEVKVGDRIQLK